MDAILHTTPGNPVPENHTAGFFMGSRGIKLRYAIFRSSAPACKGTVVLMQGRNESIEKYYETIRELTARGLWVATYDMRGQGGSHRLHREPVRGHLRRFGDYERDLEIFLDHVVLPDTRLPFFMIAHSSGALVALSHAPLLANRIERMALCAPFVGLADTPMRLRLARCLSLVLSHLGLGHVMLGTDQRGRVFEGNPLTSDERRFTRNAAIFGHRQELVIGRPTARWLHEMLKAKRRVMRQEHLTRITIPTLVIAPMRDAIVPYADQEKLSRIFRAAQLIPVAGSRHEVLQEKDIYRAQAIAAIAAFIPGGENEDDDGPQSTARFTDAKDII